MLKQENWSGMTIQREVITLQDKREDKRALCRARFVF
jgi:hypothetical protein